MKPNFLHIGAFLLILFAAASCMFRYTLVPAATGDTDGFVYKLDRWTGKVEAIYRTTSVEVSITKN